MDSDHLTSQGAFPPPPCASTRRCSRRRPHTQQSTVTEARRLKTLTDWRTSWRRTTHQAEADEATAPATPRSLGRPRDPRCPQSLPPTTPGAARGGGHVPSLHDLNTAGHPPPLATQARAATMNPVHTRGAPRHALRPGLPRGPRKDESSSLLVRSGQGSVYPLPRLSPGRLTLIKGGMTLILPPR